MLFGILTLITALALAGVAAWFSIAGLMIFFGGMPLSIAIMAGTLEIGKLVTVSWLYRFWEETGLLVKSYLTTAVIVLMLITSAGIYGYLSKAASDVSSDGAVAVAEVERVDGLILREQNKIANIEDRILSIGGSVDVSESITQQEAISDGAWERVQGDIDYAQEQIGRLRDQLATLDAAVNELRNKGVEVITTEEGGIFQGDTTQTIDYVAQANTLYAQQESQRADIKIDIDKQQANIDNYRLQAQDTINGANAEINRLRNTSSNQQDLNIDKINAFNTDIDAIYDTIATLKDTKFEAESVVRDLDREIGPIKYVAELLYGSSEQSIMDKSVRIFILLFVFVFDPLAIMLLIAANQTLLRYGVNLEGNGPKSTPPDDTPPQDEQDEEYDYGKVTEKAISIEERGRPDGFVFEQARQELEAKKDASQKKRLEKMEKALSLLTTKYQKTLKALDDKPKEIIKEVEKIIEVEKIVEVEVPVEVIKEVIVTKEVEVEKVIEVKVEVPVEVEKEIMVTVEKEVPGPERIVKVPGPERVVERIVNVPGPERIIEKIIEVPITEYVDRVVEVEKIIENDVTTDTLRDAARLMSLSEFNKEDLSEDQLFDMLTKQSEDEVQRKIGFWAMPLPTDETKEPTNKKYLGKK